MTTHPFQAEIRQLLDILVHNVYSSKDVFLRELLSNATDALEKVRFLIARGETVAQPDAELAIAITVSSDPVPKLTITDTGIGMTADEVRDNLGTIARSGAARFLESMRAKKGDADSGDSPSEDAPSADAASESPDGGPGTDPTAATDEAKLIGRFGIGFYSVFMVAESVTLTTRSADPSATAVRWTSDGTGSYELASLEGDHPRGTTIELTLRKDEGRFAEADTVRDTIQTHSNFIPFPVRLDGEQVNHTVALWREPPTSVKPEDYDAFAKLISHDDRSPLAHLHTVSDGSLQFQALLFVMPPDPFGLPNPEDETQVQLYTRRVLIDRAARGLLPPYLRFIRGVVESEDLPLNLSRETLQENTVITRIRKALTRRITDRLQEIAKDDPEKYQAIWKAYGPILREAIRDYNEHERLAELLRLPSTRTEGDSLIGLETYVSGMRDRQKGIYFLPVTSRSALARDPRAEWFKRHNIELLFLENPVDEIVLQSLNTYKDKPIHSAEQILPEDREAFQLQTSVTGDEPSDPAMAKLIERLKTLLTDRVADVRVTDRLTDSPVMLRSDDAGPSRSVQRLQKMMGLDLPISKPILEVHADHAAIRDLASRVERGADEAYVSRAGEALFQAARLLDADTAEPQAAAVAVFDLLTALAPSSASGATDPKSSASVAQTESTESQPNKASETSAPDAETPTS